MKRSSLVRKTPIKRGSAMLKRKTPLQPRRKPSERDEQREAHLRRFRGLPCAVCGSTDWARHKTTAHHILKAENYPEYYFEDWNSIVLCAAHHVPFAHDREAEFLKWLKKHEPIRFKIVEEHRHHRKERVNGANATDDLQETGEK